MKDGDAVVDTFLKVLAFMVDSLRRADFSPTHLVVPTISRNQLTMTLPHLDDNMALEQLRQILELEPPTHATPSPELNWQIKLRPYLRRFAGLQNVGDYLERVTADMQPEALPPAPRYPSPLALPESIGYLDATWKLRFERSLVTAPGLAQCARLALDVGSVEEFQASLSALSEVLSGLRVPKTDGVTAKHALGLLVPYLTRQLPATNTGRIQHAVEALDAIRLVRNGIQHSDASTKAVNALRSLGIHYPVTSWSEAWDRIRKSATEAFDALRDEVALSPSGAEG